MYKIFKTIGALGVGSLLLATGLLALPNMAKAEGFSGSVWFIWNCNNNYCASKIEGIEGTQKDISPEGKEIYSYHTKMIHDTDINDVSDATIHPDASVLTEDDYRLVWEDKYDSLLAGETLTTWDDYLNWEEEYIGDDYDKKLETLVNPTNAARGENIISTNGDRQFRLTIWHDGYFGVTNAANPSDFTYFPDFWDQGMFNPAYDLSGTTADTPQKIQAYLREPKVTLKSDTATPISSVTALDIRSDAVTITESSAGNFDIVFNSNYYDDVTFEITAGGQKYYVEIIRVTVGGDFDGSKYLYLPEGETSNYDIVATYYLADGSKKTEVMTTDGTPAVENRGINVNKYKYTGTLDSSLFGHNEWIGVSYTAVKKGSTVNSYAGTLAGSGVGTYYNVIAGEILVIGGSR